MEFSGFDWDHGNRDKCCKHGVSIYEIESLFVGVTWIGMDHTHSQREERLKAFGTTDKGRKLLVAFTLRLKDGELLVRPISARYMHQKEAKYYEEKTTTHIKN